MKNVFSHFPRAPSDIFSLLVWSDQQSKTYKFKKQRKAANPAGSSKCSAFMLDRCLSIYRWIDVLVLWRNAIVQVWSESILLSSSKPTAVECYFGHTSSSSECTDTCRQSCVQQQFDNSFILHRFQFLVYSQLEGSNHAQPILNCVPQQKG